MWPRASTASQGRSELQTHDATVLQCLAVEVREGGTPGLCHTSSASFLGTPHSGQLPCAMPRRCFRPLVSLLQGDLLDHELPSVERDRVTGALALQLSIDRSLSGDAPRSRYRRTQTCLSTQQQRKTVRPSSRRKSSSRPNSVDAPPRMSLIASSFGGLHLLGAAP